MAALPGMAPALLERSTRLDRKAKVESKTLKISGIIEPFFCSWELTLYNSRCRRRRRR